ncbi:hypothetical protein [Paraburkholderia sp. C35]|uniref:hypothetical protein n=1 Tax=Paraburkholderia sp. C35 TaxID=2126993 RepID=UPI000D69FA10|nr:hypothetical protein [Paraburkholderia sp. C35]
MKEAPPELMSLMRQETLCEIHIEDAEKELKKSGLTELLRENAMQGKFAAIERLNEVRGQKIGVWRAYEPERDGVMRMYSKYIAEGGSIEHVKAGLKLAQKHQKQIDIATGEDERQRQERRDAWNQLSTTEQRDRLDASRRHREQFMGEPQHHGEKHMFGPAHRRKA